MYGLRVHLTAFLPALALGLGACAAPGAGTSSPTTAPRTPTSAATSTPSFLAAVDELALLPGESAGDWWTIGLVGNHDDQAMLLSSIRVTLTDAAGAVLAQAEAVPSTRRLLPGEQAPFAIPFSTIPDAASAYAEAPAEPAEPFQRARVEVEELRTWPEARGGWVVVGKLVNRSSAPAAIDGVAILSRRPDGLATGVAQSGISCGFLRPSESCLVVATLAAGPEPQVLIGFVDAAQSPSMPTPAVAFPDTARLVADARGDPLLLGSLRNEGGAPMWIGILATLRRADELLTAGWISPPVPVAPGETRAFALADFPGWEALAADADWTLDDIEVDLSVDPYRTNAAEAEATTLETQVTQIEQVSDRLFLQGSLRNGWTTQVYQPAALVTVRRTDGRLVTAGWIILAESLAPNETREFLLVLPLPPRADIAMAEFDVVGAGLGP